MRKPKQNKSAQVVCTMKHKVISYWVAVTPSGEELPMEGLKDWLFDGKQVIGTVHETTEQGKYTDGTYSRDEVTHRYLKVETLKI